MKHAFIFLWLVIPGLAYADESTPLLYTRDDITIVRTHFSDSENKALPWQVPVGAHNPNVTFDVEVRDGTALYKQKGWYNLTSPDDMRGVMLLFANPVTAPVTRSTQYAPLDILFVDHEGTIKEIVPTISLSNLDNDITPKELVLALIFLKGGICQKLSILPGDTVNYSLFKKPPTILTLAPIVPDGSSKPVAPSEITKALQN